MTPPDRRSRARGFAVVAVAHLAALAAAIAVAALLPAPAHPLARAAAADLAATLVVFGFSAALDNSSLYDPYWSLAPPLLALGWLASGAAAAGAGASGARQALAFGLVAIWAVRLTWNWARRWRGLADEDWRYRRLRATAGALYWPVSLAGIHLMPTALVFLGCVPLWLALTAPGRAFGLLDVLAASLTAAAVAVESVADAQLRRFVRGRRTSGNEVMSAGLWAFARHPNYLGEVLFWWGLGLFGVAAAPQLAGAALIGPVAITLLFAFVSVPMMDRHLLASRPAYAERLRQPSRLWRRLFQAPADGASTSAEAIAVPLRRRPFDWLLLGFFWVNLLVITYLFDIEQVVIANPALDATAPSGWPPSLMVELAHWWERTFDPLLWARPVWYKATIWIDLVFFGPFYAFAIYAFTRGREWIRIPAAVWASAAITNVTIILSEEIWGPVAAPNPWQVIAANGGWVLFPLLTLARVSRARPLFAAADRGARTNAPSSSASSATTENAA